MDVGRLRRWWNAYWFAPIETHSLSLLRLFFGLTFFFYVTGFWGLYRLDRLDMDFPRRPVFEIGEMLGAVRMPYPGLGWLPVPSPWMYERLEEILLVLSVMIVIGLLTRWAVPAAALVFGYLFLVTQWSYHHHSFLMLIVLTILAFAPCGDHYSVDSMIGRSGARPRASALPLRLLQMLVVIVYLFSGLSKLDGGWLSGDPIRLLHEGDRLHGVLAQPAMDLLGPRLIGIVTVEAELFVAIALLFPGYRRAAILVGVLLHLGIDAMLDVGTFSYQMMALYVAFIVPAAGATVAVFDGTCGHCARWSRLTRPLDWLDRVTWLEKRTGEVRDALPAAALPGPGDLTVVRPDGRIERGFAAWRHLLASFPLTFLPSAVLYLPPARWLGERFHLPRVRRHRRVARADRAERSAGSARTLAASRRRVRTPDMNR